jgi:methylated-DNA-[protein]-cysteine S-methyltransferase
MLYTSLDSPLGELLLVGDGRALHGLHMQEGRTAITVDPGWEAAEEPFAEARTQLAEYFAGRRTVFDLPLAMAGSPFQRRAWRALQDIPYGETISYGDQARRIGRPADPRAVGQANGRNPIAVIVPCHRVIGADGSLTGYGGGVERKRLLLELEAGVLALC